MTGMAHEWYNCRMRNPNNFVVVGGILIVAAALISVPGSFLAYQVVDASAPSGQVLLTWIEGFSRFSTVLLPPTGASLLAAGLVLRYQQREHRTDPASATTAG